MDLVTLHTALEATKGETKFRKDIFYRHVDYGNGNHVVNGEDFTDVEFNSLFEDAITKVKRDWIEIGLLKPNGSPISKNAFKNLADIHRYGYGRKTLKVLAFRKTRDKIYAFYPDIINIEQTINECYRWYLETINGNTSFLDDKMICFGNCGMPLTYSKLKIQ